MSSVSLPSFDAAAARRPARRTVLAARLFLGTLRILGAGLAVLLAGAVLGATGTWFVERRDDDRRRSGFFNVDAGRAKLVHAGGEVCLFVDGRFVDKTTHVPTPPHRFPVD